ncbi:HEPN domain-containing protein, partial [Tychonema sp. BBK16]|uniref:HEPN domain-containing protein n=1 Tax=Tychonema sp. BBK16 TaxID=2699888 RepID=UPI0038D3297B
MRELRATKSPNYDATCFHAQQCVEKYLKGRLQEAGISFSKTHNLTFLLDLLLPVEPNYNIFRQKLLALTAFAVAYRYPGRAVSFSNFSCAKILNENINIRLER